MKKKKQTYNKECDTYNSIKKVVDIFLENNLCIQVQDLKSKMYALLIIIGQFVLYSIKIKLNISCV